MFERLPDCAPLYRAEVSMAEMEHGASHVLSMYVSPWGSCHFPEENRLHHLHPETACPKGLATGDIVSWQQKSSKVQDIWAE